MIHKFPRRFYSQKSPISSAFSSAVPRIITCEQHGIIRNCISPCAIKITSDLQQAGYSAFVVGGAVRDLLMGLEPKDFDVVTNAKPEEVRAIFRRSRIIGRRFRLVHVICGAETIEVSTFRGNSVVDKNTENRVYKHAHADEYGRILRDNVFGSQEEDAKRRDFTVNALFYDPDSEEIWDYLGGYDDIQAKQLRIIGTPLQRYREDPIRMLRAVRLAAKLNLQIDAATATPIGDLAFLLQNVPPSRLFDEMLKLLLSGHAQTCMADLGARGLYHGLLPMLDVVFGQPHNKHFISLALKNTDERVRQEKTISPGFLFAALLWHEVLSAWNSHKASGEKPTPAIFSAMNDVLAEQEKKLAIPRRYDVTMKEIWAMQPRFLIRTGRRPFHLIEHPRFRAAYDFMLLRCESGEMDKEIGNWWDTFQHAKVNEREKMLLKGGVSRKRKRRRPRGEAISSDVGSVNCPVANTTE